jgi:hypothetical protein
VLAEGRAVFAGGVERSETTRNEMRRMAALDACKTSGAMPFGYFTQRKPLHLALLWRDFYGTE